MSSERGHGKLPLTWSQVTRGRSSKVGTAEGSSSRNPGHKLQPAQGDTLAGWFSVYCHTHPTFRDKAASTALQGGQGWINHFQAPAERGDSQTQGGTSLEGHFVVRSSREVWPGRTWR